MSSIKRQRTAISCSVCRKRKSKCDRQRPVCGSCRKKSIAHLCSYDEEQPLPPNHFYAPGASPGFWHEGMSSYMPIQVSNPPMMGPGSGHDMGIPGQDMRAPGPTMVTPGLNLGPQPGINMGPGQNLGAATGTEIAYNAGLQNTPNAGPGLEIKTGPIFSPQNSFTPVMGVQNAENAPGLAAMSANFSPAPNTFNSSAFSSASFSPSQTSSIFPAFAQQPSPGVPWTPATLSYLESSKLPPKLSQHATGGSSSSSKILRDASKIDPASRKNPTFPRQSIDTDPNQIKESDSLLSNDSPQETPSYVFHTSRPRENSVTVSPHDAGRRSPKEAATQAYSQESVPLDFLSMSADSVQNNAPKITKSISQDCPQTQSGPQLGSRPHSRSRTHPQSRAHSRSYSVPSTSSGTQGIRQEFQQNKNHGSVSEVNPGFTTASMRRNGSISEIRNETNSGFQANTLSFPDDATFSSELSDASYPSPNVSVYRQKSDAFGSEDPSFVNVSIGQNVLRIAVDDTIDAFSGASSTLLVEGSHWQQQGPMSYVGLTKQDQFFRLVRNFTVRLFRSEQFSQFTPQGQKKNTDQGKKGSLTGDPGKSDLHSDTNDEVESEDDIVDEDTLVTTKIHAGREMTGQLDRQSANLPGVQSLYEIHRCKRTYFRYVQEKVASILPCKAAVAEAVNRYFQYVHPFVPIINEATFSEEIKPLLNDGPIKERGQNSGRTCGVNTGFGLSSDPRLRLENEKTSLPFSRSDKYNRISIRNSSQLNLAGQLLLMVRLGYMTLIPNNATVSRYSRPEQMLIKEVTQLKADHYLSIVNLCISEEKVQTKSTFKLVQSLTLLFFYRSVAPNDCLGLSGSDSQLLHGAIVSHALSIGLNRDPLKYTTINSISKDANFVATWRALWSYIVNMDAMNSIYSGTALKIHTLSISDTERPTYPNTSENVAQLAQTVDSVCGYYRRIVRRMTNRSTELKVIDLLSETSKLERIFLEIFGKDFFKDYVCGSAPEEVSTFEPGHRERNEEAFLKVHRFILFINIRANLSCLYYLVVLHYEQKLDEDQGFEASAGIELFKIFIRSVVQLVYIMSYVLDNMQELFGKSYDYLLTSRIERAMIKTHTFVSAFFIRLVNYKRTLALKQMARGSSASSTDESFAERCEIVDTLFTIVLLEAELFVGHFRTLSKTYINSYKLYVMAFFVLKQCMENPELLLAGVTNSKESFFNDGTNLIQFLSNPELQSLCKLCEEFRLAKLESVRRQKEHQKVHGNGSNIERRPSGEKRARTSDSEGSVDPSRRSREETGSLFEDDLSSQASGSFDPTSANRAMYANEDTVNTYGLLTEKHMHSDFQDEVFDEQNMIGNDELLKLFDSYGLLEC